MVPGVAAEQGCSEFRVLPPRSPVALDGMWKKLRWNGAGVKQLGGGVRDAWRGGRGSSIRPVRTVRSGSGWHGSPSRTRWRTPASMPVPPITTARGRQGVRRTG